jgi:hypothetical protein
MVLPSAGTTQPVSEKFSTASVRNCPNGVPPPGAEELVVSVGHHRSSSGSPASKVPERLKVIGPEKLPDPALLLLAKLEITMSSAEPPVKLVALGFVKTLSLVLATSWSNEPLGIGVVPSLSNNSAAPRLIVTLADAAIAVTIKTPTTSSDFTFIISIV